MWDPGQYRRFGDERSRPFFDLVGRIGADQPNLVADLGCGPGELTATLAERWPRARVTGVDSSPAMIETARSEIAEGEAAGGERAGSERAEGETAMIEAAGGERAGSERAEGKRAMIETAGGERSGGERARTETAGGETLGGETLRGGPGPGGRARGRLSFELGDVTEWAPEAPVDVLVANAVLQWLPRQLDVLARWAGLLADGGWLAVQAPGNFDQPGHVIMREIAASARWAPLLDGVVLNRQAADPGDYLDKLAAAGCRVDAWETTYLHVLPGGNPVLEWYKGTGLRPVIDALSPDLAEEFLAEYGARVRAAYPARPYGTVLPFRRVFVVARRP
jgi:trans-aconitate 2-methyltransferase